MPCLRWISPNRARCASPGLRLGSAPQRVARSRAAELAGPFPAFRARKAHRPGGWGWRRRERDGQRRGRLSGHAPRSGESGSFAAHARRLLREPQRAHLPPLRHPSSSQPCPPQGLRNRDTSEFETSFSRSSWAPPPDSRTTRSAHRGQSADPAISCCSVPAVDVHSVQRRRNSCRAHREAKLTPSAGSLPARKGALHGTRTAVQRSLPVRRTSGYGKSES